MSLQRIRDASDIQSIETRGLSAFLPVATPYDIIERSARLRPQAIALHYLRTVDAPETDLLISYGELAQRVRQSANLFRRLGLTPDDAVVILMPHVPSGQIALWGAETAGRACPINPMLRPEHIVELVRAAKAKIAVVLGNNADLDIWSAVTPALRASGLLTHILHADADYATPHSDGCFEELIGAEPGDRLTFERSADPNSIAAYFHTGGTTGAPKLAMHTQRNQAFVAAGAATMYELEPHDVLVNGFPLFHVAGSMVYGLSVLFAGATIFIPTRTGMRNRAFVTSIWRHVERYGITAIGGVPTVISALNAVPLDADITILRVMLTGGSPLPSELADAFERTFNKPVRNILGMTECAGVVSIEPFAAGRTAGSTGMRLPFTSVQAFSAVGDNADLDSPCAPGETGVIALRGPNVGPGYTDTVRNTGTFEPGGWLVSGDLGHVDAEGRIFVTGRAKDVIIRGAHNIDPAMIEDALLRLGDVAIAAAVGQPDAYAGEVPVAFVTLHPGSTADGAKLARDVAAHISEPAAVPKQIIVLADMPMTPVGKIYKPALRVLATRKAIEDALIRAGIDMDSIGIAITESNSSIRVANAADEDLARTALTGMPIRYTISSQT